MDTHVEVQPSRKCCLIILDIIPKNNNKNPNLQFSVNKERIFWLYWEFADKLEMNYILKALYAKWQVIL